MDSNRLARIERRLNRLEDANATLVLPNNTKVIIKGDSEVVKQVINRLDGLVIEYKYPHQDQ